MTKVGITSYLRLWIYKKEQPVNDFRREIISFSQRAK